ncbi:RibD C-terminal domain-containing protein [Frankineae bacterium MT45]|nr:RibD C-terminal domain-containing protein [Frankineae bacterium MT45]
MRERYVTPMGLVTCQISISLDGFTAGLHQSRDNPLGDGGLRLHQWIFATESWNRRQGNPNPVGQPGTDADSAVIDEATANVGAYIMGRHMFGEGGGYAAGRGVEPDTWDETWTGWWGENPPYHVPVFVLTHYPREPLTMQGGTTFNFVTGGAEEALAQARAAAGDRDVSIAGGAATVQQFLRAGLLDELYLHIAPVLLGGGERLLENVGDLRLEPIKVVASPAVTHIKYRVSNGSD